MMYFERISNINLRRLVEMQNSVLKKRKKYRKTQKRKDLNERVGFTVVQSISSGPDTSIFKIIGWLNKEETRAKAVCKNRQMLLQYGHGSMGS